MSILACSHSAFYVSGKGECIQCALLDARILLENVNEKIKSGDLDSVEAWLADPNVCHGELSKPAMESLCLQLREARKDTALIDALDALLRESNIVSLSRWTTESSVEVLMYANGNIRRTTFGSLREALDAAVKEVKA